MRYIEQSHNIGFVPLEVKEGETIETKIARVVENKEPITDGAPPIYTKKGDGVLPATNIRTDKWDIALDAMDKAHKAKIAQGKTLEESPKKSDKSADESPSGGEESHQ